MPLSVLQKLLESRDAAQKAFDDFVTPLITAGTALTDEQTTTKTELRTAVTELDERIDEVDAQEKRNAQLAEVRSRLGAGGPQERAEVTEPTTYGPGAEHSYYLDLMHANNPIDPLFNESRERLTRASHEVAVEYATTTSKEKRQRIARIVAEEYRTGGRDSVSAAMKRMEAIGKTGRSELRAMSTGSTSGGSFATPVYLIGDYAPYNEAGRAFADQVHSEPLPDYGMTVYMPHVTGPAGIGVQPGENQGITDTEPTAGYLSSGLVTLAGEVPLSQQLLDRAGPGFPFDKMIFDQLARDYAPKLDQYALTQALAGGGTINYTDAGGFTPAARTLPAAGGFFGRIGAAKTAIRTGAGTFMNPTHIFLQPARWDYLEAWADSNGRPIVVPNYAGPFNAPVAGSATGDTGIEGATGYKIGGLQAYTDFNIPAPGTGADQAIVANLSEVWLFEGSPVTRVLPQTLAGTLTVLLQQYSYVACIVRYPLAVQSISGSGMSTIAYT